MRPVRAGPTPPCLPESHLTCRRSRCGAGRDGASGPSLAPSIQARGSPGSSSSAARLLLTAYGTWEMYQVVSVSRTTILQWVLVGAVHRQLLVDRPRVHQRAPGLPRAPAAPRLAAACRPALASRTAIVMPVYNEQTERAPSRRSRRSANPSTRPGLGAHFDYFILSDTTDPDAWIAEERAFLALRERLGPGSAPLLPPPGQEPPPQGRQHRRFRQALGRRIRPHARARRRQPDDRRVHRAPRRRDGGRSRRRHHPDPAADHQPQHPVRAPAAVRRAGLRPGHRDRPSAWMGRDGNYWGHNAIIRTAGLRRPMAACRTSRASRPSAATSSATISSRRP